MTRLSGSKDGCFWENQMTVDDLLNMWADWLHLPCAPARLIAKHPLAKLMDGLVGGKPVYSSFIPSGIAIDERVVVRVDMAIASLSKQQIAVIKAEYLGSSSSQEEKAQRLCITHDAYRMCLCRAKKNLSLKLNELLKIHVK